MATTDQHLGMKASIEGATQVVEVAVQLARAARPVGEFVLKILSSSK